ncbi:NucA/NucB deoxyribonuclease domain-containing protein [Streptomyces sp. NPDC054849]
MAPAGGPHQPRRDHARAGRREPGRATPGDPVHRRAQAKGTDQNTRYNDNRRIVRSFCRTKVMQDLRNSLPAAGGPYDCDEYAFASTYEGAGRYLHDGAQYENHYSARWGNSDVNQEAGRRLGRWYNVDRILDHERFYIPITNYTSSP